MLAETGFLEDLMEVMPVSNTHTQMHNSLPVSFTYAIDLWQLMTLTGPYLLASFC